MSFLSSFPNTRMRRLRQHPQIRSLMQETQLQIKDLISPIFIRYGQQIKQPISSMPSYYQLSVDQLAEEIEVILALGIKSVLLFGIPEYKDLLGQASYDDNGIIQCAVSEIKRLAPQLLVITDVCFCEYTNHGHCGVVHDLHGRAEVDNDETLALLAKQAVSHAKAGADIVAPSCMMDGMVGAIRHGLDTAGYSHIPILSYAVKYASSFYGPFREAAQGAPSFGDRKTYQMDFANQRECIRECELDINEGADMLMVKPAHAYLDIILRVKEAFPSMPLGAYHTSGEFAMIKAASEKKWLDEKAAVFEVLTAIKRAGADFIITYFAKDVASWLTDELA